jgi:hypothetical protein
MVRLPDLGRGAGKPSVKVPRRGGRIGCAIRVSQPKPGTSAGAAFYEPKTKRTPPQSMVGGRVGVPRRPGGSANLPYLLKGYNGTPLLSSLLEGVGTS